MDPDLETPTVVLGPHLFCASWSTITLILLLSITTKGETLLLVLALDLDLVEALELDFPLRATLALTASAAISEALRGLRSLETGKTK
ncbi:hypothetical protein HanXRQr2_Chr06g0278381 [Helianthus annuus]|uniref:Uncharacterized protein n=1 Tax=Helianthus annuus TaxID=4232 RepID=A0A9K3NLF9_HELAN|nr:hypothetical protein HanXRQr2_Chr06g0278381 [Helianthus annuus]KAJ0917093.1 hypothetical protein HanPSC8_Chr06g0269371 [Helianthus annuus]